MDPQLTSEALIQAWCLRDWPQVVEHSDALLEWLAKGGYAPVTIPTVRLGDDWNTEVAKAACQFALRRSQQVLDDANGIPADVPFILTCADIWENESQHGSRHNVTLSRLYRDGEEWKDSTSFGRDDLLLVAKVADQAHTWIFENSNAGANGNTSFDPERLAG
ncbi:MAG: hypothetical protein AB8B50_13275 [Pirellulaceae bacterium]